MVAAMRRLVLLLLLGLLVVVAAWIAWPVAENGDLPGAADREQDDARPSFVTDYGDGYLTVFSGKIDRSLSIADLVCLKLNDFFNNRAR